MWIDRDRRATSLPSWFYADPMSPMILHVGLPPKGQGLATRSRRTHRLNVLPVPRSKKGTVEVMA